MTRSTNMEHVEVLRELRDTGDVSDWRAMESALDAAIAALSAPKSGDWVLVPREPSAGMWDSAENAMVESECAYNAGKQDARSDAHGFPTMRIWQAVVAYRAMLASAPQPPAEAQPDRMAIKMLVAAGFVTEAKANEALNIAHGFDKGPLAPPSAPGCGSCSDGCVARGTCRVRDESPPSAPVGVAADILRIVDTAIDVCNDRDRPAMAEDLEAVRLYVEQASAPLAQQPAAVDEAMVERALQAWFETDDWVALLSGIEPAASSRSRMRAALTAALAAQQGGSDNDR